MNKIYKTWHINTNFPYSTLRSLINAINYQKYLIFSFFQNPISHFLKVQSSQARTIQAYHKPIVICTVTQLSWAIGFPTTFPSVDLCENLNIKLCEMTLILHYLCILLNEEHAILELILEFISKTREERVNDCKQYVPEVSSFPRGYFYQMKES